MGANATSAPRSRRDWIVDTACFALAVAGGVYGPAALLENGADPSPVTTALIVAAGVVAGLAIWLRRRWPLGVALLTVVLGCVSPAAGGAAMIALFSLAMHRRAQVAIATCALSIALLPLYFSLYPDDIPFWVNVLLASGIQSAVVGWGMFIRSQRELMLALRERTAQAEAERDLRVGQARAQERTSMAREMHDVLAHRLSLLSLHAGALEVHPNTPPEEIARAAAVVRASAHQALEDLREVIDVLGAKPAGAEKQRPQPTIADVAGLVEESGDAGTAMAFDQRVDTASVPAATGRTVYRVVQEGLTNALKHSPGSAVQTTIDGAPGSGLTVLVVSRRPLAQFGGAEIPGSGAGLIGLEERVGLAGGRLEHGRNRAGDYRLWRGCRGRHERPHQRADRRRRRARAGRPVDDARRRARPASRRRGRGRHAGTGRDRRPPPRRGPDGHPHAQARRARHDAARARSPGRAAGDRADDVRRPRARAHRAARRRRRLPRQGHAAGGDPGAIRLVAAGEAMLSPAVTRTLVDHMAADAAPASSARAVGLLGELTDREREVALAVGQGSSNAEIAAALYMSVATVKAHVSRLLSKLGVDNRVHIALLVHDAGLSADAR